MNYYSSPITPVPVQFDVASKYFRYSSAPPTSIAFYGKAVLTINIYNYTAMNADKSTTAIGGDYITSGNKYDTVSKCSFGGATLIVNFIPTDIFPRGLVPITVPSGFS